MMIKLFLVTLLCVAVFADSPVDKFGQGWKEQAEGVIDMANHFISGGTGGLVRRAAEDQRGPPPPPHGSPPNSGSGQQQQN